ncbi:hypothetical protein M8997_009660 [Phyllobacterium sp. 21LDTY02-6]|jgi:hypothetical protein|uniref:hypothetical protein n=1 Tax=unclassified Phyllobacterium TaxID=2638441 RepID=UPI002020F388|nr:MULTISPECIES: hypothetical protein [unclassified Phyllobacterium]MCO4317448.1 hypothetical protein [Phyllobacterium sp. 21LDTY02-6]MCX8293173.1 hypothetical protein [Phyllobacterium sp. 0TCS1.6A]
MAEDKNDNDAARILDRVARESSSDGRSLASRTRGHFSARDADPADSIEVWGTRIGRLLGLLVLIAMFVWLMASIFGYV